MSTGVEADHLRAAHERQVAIYRAMTPQQRLEQAMRMNQSMPRADGRRVPRKKSSVDGV
jgi:hypothetical protein